MITLRTFIQARMTSSRFPGKVLAPLQGQPVLRHVITCMEEAGITPENIVVLTSKESTDDPVATYAASQGVSVFRGSLENVMQRFIDAAEAFPCDWILRATADSPYYQSQVVRFAVEAATRSNTAFATTTYKRTLPKGMNVELIQPNLLRDIIGHADTTESDREHLTSPFHRCPPKNGICSIGFEKADFSQHSVAIDSLEDLKGFQKNPPTALIESMPWQQLQSCVVHS